MNYFEGYNDKYHNTFEYWVTKVRHRHIIASMARRRPESILEVGPGPDPIFVLYKEAWARYVVMEPLEEYAMLSEQLATELELPIEIVRRKVEEGADGKFDYVILSSLIHEVPNPEEVLLAAKRLCREKGTVHINVPNVHSLHMLLGVEMGIVQDVFDLTEAARRFGRPTRFDMPKLTDMVEECGMEIVEAGSYLLKPFSNEIMAKIATPEMVQGLVVMGKAFPANGCELYVEAVPC